MSSLYYHGLMGNIEEHEGKKLARRKKSILDKVLDKIILADDITLKSDINYMWCQRWS